MTQTYIPGKDDSLENTIARMQSALSENGFNIVEHSWGNPAPNIWWVHIRDADNPLCFTNGKGATKLAARASALGEFIERLSCNYFFADYYLGKDIAQDAFVHYPDEKWFPVDKGTLANNCPAGLLSDELAEFYDPENELLLTELYDINAGIQSRGICALPFQRQRDASTVYFPVNIIANLYVSNGMSAGSTPAEARTQALSEIFERWVKNKIIAEGISLPEIPQSILSRYPLIESAIAEMSAQGYIVKVYDASLGGKFPVIGAVLLNPADSGCLTSFGAHPDFSVAVERTITEILQGRELKDLGTFPSPTYDDEWVADDHNLETHFIDSTGLVSWQLFSAKTDYDFVDWDFRSETDNEFAFLLDLLHQQQADVYITNYDFLGVYACRVIVPSISEIYPIEELTQYNNNIGNSVRELILALPNQPTAEHFERVLSWLDESGLDDSERLSQVLGLSIENTHAWHFVRLGELRAYCYLGLSDGDSALDAVEWVLTFSSNAMPAKRQRFFACLKEQLIISLSDEMDAANFAEIHAKVFGEDIYQLAVVHITGGAFLHDLTAVDEKLTTVINHQQWLSRYRAWQQVKSGQNR